MSLLRLGILGSHPIQYHAPVFRELARCCDLTVHFAHRQTPEGQAAAGFGVPFDWDVDLLAGYKHHFLHNVAMVPGSSTFGGCDTPEVGDSIADGRFDAFLVTGWNLKAYWQAVSACRRLGVPVMVRGDSQLATRRGAIKRAAKRLLYPRLLRQFDRCLYVGSRSREYYECYNVSEARLTFSPHCVDNDWFAKRGTEEGAHAWRRQHDIEPARPVFAFVGRLIDVKRPADFIRATAKLGSTLSPVAVFAGDGGLRTALEREARECGLDARFLGFCNQSQLPAIYAAADVLCLPSGEETWGLVVNEAMACGTPAVVSDACGCAPDLIEQGRTGYVFPTGNVEALADSLMRTSSLKRSAAGRSALAEKLAIYSVPRTVEGILQAAEACIRANCRV